MCLHTSSPLCSYRGVIAVWFLLASCDHTVVAPRDDRTDTSVPAEPPRALEWTEPRPIETPAEVRTRVYALKSAWKRRERDAVDALLVEARALEGETLAPDDRTMVEVLRFELDLSKRYQAILRRTMRRIGRVPLRGVPGGEDAFRVLAYAHTTLELEPAELVAFAEAELAAAESSMLRRARDLGADAPDMASFRAWLFRERARFALDPDELRDRTVRAMNRVEVAAILGPPPVISLPAIVIEPVNAYALGRYTGSREPPTFYLRVPLDDDLPAIYAEPLAFHEGLPGHHLQASVRREALPRTLGDYSAFVEGWAMYAEGVADEQGLYSDPWGRLGLDAFRAWRAARMRIDLGIHLEGWTVRHAREYLTAHTILGRATLAKEARRIVGDPAQSLAYLIGEREILAARARARASLGDRFDLRRFHSVVLDAGPVPFTTMNRRVDLWIEGESRESTPSRRP